jgi:hypothetical protein
VKNIIRRDYYVYSGKVLERYFIQKLKATGNFSAIGNYWEKGNKNEIDIVAINEAEKRIEFYEIKRNPANIKINDLVLKSSGLVKKLPGFKTEYKGLSLDDM